MPKTMLKSILGILAAAGLAASAVAAEPELVLSKRVSGKAEGRLVRTAQGLALLGEGGLTPLEGERAPSAWGEQGWVTPAPPAGRWFLAVEKPRTGGFAEPQRRGRMVLGDLDAAAPISAQSKVMHNAAWPVAVTENPDGSLTMLVWAKAPPFVTEPGYRLVRYRPGTYLRDAQVADWPGGPKVVGPSQMMADGQGGWSLLSRLDEDGECGRRAGFSLTRIDAALKVSPGPSVCLPEAFTPFTTEIIAAALTPRGPVWFVSGKQAGAHRIGRIEASGETLRAKALGELPAGEIVSVAYDGTDLLLVQAGRAMRVAPGGEPADVDLPAPSCDGRKADGKPALLAAVIDGKLHLAAIADGCVNVWRL
ncbi:MAG TPA: hypothetical protein VEA44_17520 [Caulobacter sp.]|nr:hypothetical protein [Caulobacter sp.]